MATNNKRLEVTEFDFDDVKDNLKTFLGAQTEFNDYDFEGSGMSALLDVLAYNTHYLGFNANMLANEMFLDSASLRSSIVSHAKTLGYVPTSARAAKAKVDVILNTNDVNATLPAGTVFNTTVNDISYQFSTIADITKSNTGNTIPFVGVDIYEGTFITTRYTVDSSDIDQRFVLTDNRADTSTLIVKVQTSSTDSSSNTFTEATDITQVTAGSNVYFLQEVEAGLFEVYFGDGIIGTALSDDNIVLLTYVVSNKTAANGASLFTNAAAIASVTDISVATSEPSTAGAEPESLSSIKYNAPLDFASQGRCVTSEDYKVFAKKYFPNTQSVQVFGGEAGSFDTSLGVVETPEYGKVFISIKSTTGNNLTATEKSQLVTDLAPFTVASITPVIVDVQTTKLILQVVFKFDSSKTTETSSSIATLISNTLTNFNDDTLGQFEGVFRHSKVTGIIDDADNSITGNITKVTMAHDLSPTIGTSTSYTIPFNNKFYNPHDGHNSAGGGVIASTGFKISGDAENDMFFNDDGSGNLRLYYLVAGVRIYQDVTAGTVDYTKGKIVIGNINITSVSSVDGAASSVIRLTAIPDSNDIVPVRNQILEIDFTNTIITGDVDTVSTGDSSAGSTYNTTSSYTTPSSY
jgi:hypothetical protein|tara:strand:- start:1624 stop:3528 length:1905 start_codon:yes stop_codon:yes gene_type:complete